VVAGQHFLLKLEHGLLKPQIPWQKLRPETNILRGFPKIGVPQNEGVIMENPENPIKMDDLGKPTIFGNTHICLSEKLTC